MVHRASVWASHTPITFEKQEDAINITLPGYNKQLKFPRPSSLPKSYAHILWRETGFGESNGRLPQDVVGEENTEIILEPEIPKDELLGTLMTSPAEEIHAWVNEPIDNPEELELEANRDQAPPQEDTYSVVQPSTACSSEFCYINGNVMMRTAKAVAFKMEGRDQLWVPLSAINETLSPQTNAGLWIKQWFVAKVLSPVPRNDFLLGRDFSSVTWEWILKFITQYDYEANR